MMKNNIMNMAFLSCLKATELIEKRFHIKLSFIERLQLKVHKAMCNACASYEKQSEIIEKGIEARYKETQNSVDLEQLKNQISIDLRKD